VLVVDDEQAIRVIMRQALVAHGYDVLVTSSGDDAWRLIESGSAQPDLVVSDVMMPHGSGVDLVDRLIAHGSHIPVVLMSGLEGRATVADGAQRRSHGFVDKPVSTPVLLFAVHDALVSHRLRKAPHDSAG
jgi:DNA-binding NtrC family response regulator